MKDVTRISFFVAFGMLVACTSPDSFDTIPASQYFPLKTSAYYIFDVDSLVTSNTIQTNYQYELKIQVTDSFANTVGGYSYILLRSRRINENAEWTPLPSWTARANNYQVVVAENNRSFIKIEGPVVDGKIWNGNELNDLQGSEKCPGAALQSCDLYTITEYDKSFSGGGHNFEHTLTIVQNNDLDSIVYKDIRSEVYALNVGMVNRKIIQLHYCSNLESCIGQQQVTQGLQYSQTLKEYGGL